MSTWIIQGNPGRFDVDAYLLRQRDINWTVGQSKLHRRIQIGDFVFIWRSDGTIKESGGIVAQGIVTSEPQLLSDDAPDLWRLGQRSHSRIRIQIRTSQVRLSAAEGMLRRGELQQHPVLCELTILRWRNATLYAVNESQARVLDELWSSLDRSAD